MPVGPSLSISQFCFPLHWLNSQVSSDGSKTAHRNSTPTLLSKCKFPSQWFQETSWIYLQWTDSGHVYLSLEQSPWPGGSNMLIGQDLIMWPPLRRSGTGSSRDHVDGVWEEWSTEMLLPKQVLGWWKHQKVATVLMDKVSQDTKKRQKDWREQS